MRGEASRDLGSRGRRQALPLQDDRQLRHFPLGLVADLRALVRDLGAVEALLGLAGEVGAAAHGDRAGDRLRDAGDEDDRAAGVRGGHAAHDAEGNEQAVLEPKHELPDAGELADPGGLHLDVLVDVGLGGRTDLR